MAEIFLRLLYASWLPAASFLAGILNSIAGGGSFLSLPALFAGSAAVGIGAVMVQATNTVALWPGQLTGLIAFRKELREYGWELLPLGTAAGIGGWIGGFAMLVAMFLPAFLLVLGALPFWETLRQRDAIQRAMGGVNAAVVGILGAALYDPVWTSAIHSRSDVALALAAYGLLVVGRVSPVIVVALTALGGWALAAAHFAL